ncbi:MAG: hypothetical protein ACI9IT_001472, partial [Glaciecola sp.]
FLSTSGLFFQDIIRVLLRIVDDESLTVGSTA